MITIQIPSRSGGQHRTQQLQSTLHCTQEVSVPLLGTHPPTRTHMQPLWDPLLIACIACTSHNPGASRSMTVPASSKQWYNSLSPLLCLVIAAVRIASGPLTLTADATRRRSRLRCQAMFSEELNSRHHCRSSLCHCFTLHTPPPTPCPPSRVNPWILAPHQHMALPICTTPLGGKGSQGGSQQMPLPVCSTLHGGEGAHAVVQGFVAATCRAMARSQAARSAAVSVLAAPAAPRPQPAWLAQPTAAPSDQHPRLWRCRQRSAGRG